MALDTPQKRSIAAGVGRPFMRGSLPDPALDQEWRIGHGNGFGGNPLVEGQAGIDDREIGFMVDMGRMM